MTARLRLTLLSGALFLLAGVILVGLNYALMRRSLDHSPDFLVRPVIVGTPVISATRTSLPVGAATSSGATGVAELAGETQRLRDATLSTLVTQSAIALGVIAVISIGLGWWFAGRALRPVHDITAVARRLSETGLHERIGMQGPRDELKELADTFDAMLSRLEAAFEGQRRFAANASHELRTPLTVMRTEIDVALADPDATTGDLRAMAETVRNAVDCSSKMIDGLLMLAKTAQSLERREPVELAAIVADLIARAPSLAGPEYPHLDLQLQPAVATGDRVLLTRLAINLIDNALIHNVPDGWVKIITEPMGSAVRFTVANTGPPVTPDEVSAMFEPFRRLQPDRPVSDQDIAGVGLGLSIVRTIVQVHEGQITATPRPEGGLTIAIDLPSASAADAKALPLQRSGQ